MVRLDHEFLQHSHELYRPLRVEAASESGGNVGRRSGMAGDLLRRSESAA
jgi:hypothetical protein